MKTRCLFCFMTLFAFACQTDNAKPESDIFFVDLDPDIDMVSVRAFVTDPDALSSGCPKIPVPVDSTLVYMVDLTNDQSPDFAIEVTHRYKGYCGKCRYSTYNVSITGLLDGHGIAKADSEHPITKIFNHTDTINENNAWIDRGDILLIDGCSEPLNVDFTEGYIGVKIHDSYGYIHVSKLPNHGLRIMNYGFNTSKNGAICCGQQE